tara:strand:- start:456 stop:1205 length:750 start_codon:yes stop_codon:yes gene_type:complete
VLGLGSGIPLSPVLSGLAVSNYSMLFDGDGDYLSITETTFPMGDNGDKLSIAFWAKRDGTGTEDTVLTNVNTYKRRIHFNSDGDELHIEADTNGQQAKGVATADTNWHHYVITVHNADSAGTAATVVMYEDGSAVSSTNTNLGVAAGSSNGDFTINAIGSRSTGGDTGFDGRLYQVAIWNEILDSDAVAAIYNSGTPIPLGEDKGNYDNSGDLLHLWNFNEGTGSSAGDSAGSLNASLEGDAAFNSTTP